MKISRGRRDGRGAMLQTSAVGFGGASWRTCRRFVRIGEGLDLFRGRRAAAWGRRRPAVRCRTCVHSAGCAPNIIFNSSFFIFNCARMGAAARSRPGRRAASSRCSKASPSARLQAFSHRINRAAIGEPQPPGGEGPQLAACRSASGVPSQAAPRATYPYFLENRKICLFLSFRFGRSCLLQQP